MSGNPKSPQVDRLSHVVYCVRPESFEAATGLWSRVFGVTFDRLDMHDGGLRVSFSLQHGVEVVAPSANGPKKFLDFLDQHGEGVYTVVYAVADLAVAEERLGTEGVPIVDRLVYTGRRPWSEEWAALEELVLAPVHGMRITVGLMERHPEAAPR
jgi:hypothetical protein